MYQLMVLQAFIILGVLLLIFGSSGGLYELIKEPNKYKLFTSSWKNDTRLYPQNLACS
jgi:hypothetical protein